jgi:energy-coupling factor transporter transmembrane protein EcfT
MHPLTKLVIIAVIAGGISLYSRLEFKLPFVLLSFFFAYLGKLPKLWYKYVLLLLLLAVPFQIPYLFLVTNPIYYYSLPYWMTHTGFVFATDFSLGPFYLGTVGITVASIYWVTQTLINIPSIVLIISVYAYTTSPSDLMATLATLKLPSSLQLMVGIPFRFVNVLQGVFDNIINSQKLRGWKIANTRNPIKLAKLYVPLLIPISKQLVNFSDEVTIAVYSRAFGTKPITIYRELRPSLKEIVITTIMLVIYVICFLSALIFKWGVA